METATPYEPYGVKLIEEGIQPISIQPTVLKPNKQSINLIDALQTGSAYETFVGHSVYAKGKRADSIFFDDYNLVNQDYLMDRGAFEKRRQLEEEFKYAGNARVKLVEIGMQEYYEAGKKAKLEAGLFFNDCEIKTEPLTIAGSQLNLTLEKGGVQEYRLRKDDIQEMTDNGEYLIIKMK